MQRITEGEMRGELLLTLKVGLEVVRVLKRRRAVDDAVIISTLGTMYLSLILPLSTRAT